MVSLGELGLKVLLDLLGPLATLEQLEQKGTKEQQVKRVL